MSALGQRLMGQRVRRQEWRRGRVKACFTMAVAGMGLVVLAPVLAAIAAAVWMESGGPVLFRQRRVGRQARAFELLKFRSMSTGMTGTAVTAGNDRRVTRVGRFLRRYKLDELPQLWNVVRGDMSLIGPRPEVPVFIDPDDANWRTILEVRPGISDLATLIYRNEEEVLAGAADPERYYREVVLPEKMALSIHHIRTRSLRSDLKLLALTLRYSFAPAGFDPVRIRQMFFFKDNQ
jgi:lipopolysaccharide/colanic/teichoic acid biosynthesis glycosyltransferase